MTHEVQNIAQIVTSPSTAAATGTATPHGQATATPPTVPAPPPRRTGCWARLIRSRLLSVLLQVVPIILGIIVYAHEKEKDRKDREAAAYNTLDDKYMEYLLLCLAHPKLDVFDVELEKLASGEQRDELIIFSYLLAMFERSYVMYLDTSDELRDDQWSGWRQYIVSWSKRENFRRAWTLLRQDWDIRFVEEMDRIFKEVGGGSTSRPALRISG